MEKTKENDLYLFTSESVSEGHPDKVCDQISDAILDSYLEQDPDSHVACEILATTNTLIVSGEILTKAKDIDIESIARETLREIGYTDESFGMDSETVVIQNLIHEQSPDINQGVIGTGLDEFKGKQGAGDQGLMFGFACNESDDYMPATLVYSHQLLKRAAFLRKTNDVEWLRPDAKSQVTIAYSKDNKPVYIDTVVISHQHSEDVDYETLYNYLKENIIDYVLKPTGLLNENTKFFINPTGRFVTGGPYGDTGLTGRKIIVDTYGGMGRHGGGAFSGKDPSKVDRSAAYMARYIAKNIVAAKLAERCEVQLAYTIGVPFPVSIMVNTFGTGKVAESALSKAVSEVFDCSPEGIINTLNLKNPIYKKTASYGHFGRSDVPWEQLDRVETLLNKFL